MLRRTLVMQQEIKIFLIDVLFQLLIGDFLRIFGRRHGKEGL